MPKKKGKGKKKKVVYVTRGKKKGKGGKRGSTKITLNLSGMKRAIGGGKPVVYTVLGVIAARLAYGLLVKYAPDQDRKLLGGAAIAATIAAGIAASGKKAVAIPIAVGAAGAGLVDMFAGEIANMVPADQPEIQQAVAMGVGSQVFTPALPGVVTTAPVETEAPLALSGYPDAYGIGQMPDAYGISDVDMIYY